MVRKLGRWAGFLSASTPLGGVTTGPVHGSRIGKAQNPYYPHKPLSPNWSKTLLHSAWTNLHTLLPDFCYPLDSAYPFWLLAAFPLGVHPSLLIYILSSAGQLCLST